MLVYLLCKVYNNWSLIEEKSKLLFRAGSRYWQRGQSPVAIKSEAPIMMVSHVFEIFQN